LILKKFLQCWEQVKIALDQEWIMLDAQKRPTHNSEALLAFWQQHAAAQKVLTFWTTLVICNGPTLQYIKLRDICYQLTELFVAICFST
jgi:hypothetical protein